MTGKTLLSAVLLIGAVVVVHAAPVENSLDAMNYLNYYGYMQHSTDSAGGVTSEEDAKRAICDFQYMANLTQTCELDADTMAKMNMPRCGMPDNVGHAMDARRKKRYSLGSRWSKTDLTYRLDRVTTDIPNRADIDDTIAAAFKVWSDVTPLTFTRVQGTNTPADIIIFFQAGDHRDGNPFDGPSGVLAHAFFPENGDAHFDEDENWTVRSFQGINLFQVAAHEFGHSLGLGHSNIDAALMAPFYAGYVPNFQLHTDDIQGIQAQYGVGSGSPDVTMRPRPNPDAGCSGRIDAATRTRDGSTYLFEGENVYKIESGQNRIAAGFPKSIVSTFPGLPNTVDAALFYQPNGKTYFFQGSQYWRFDNEVQDGGFPRDIGRDWTGLPNNLDAAFVWSGNGNIYFVKGDQYYRFNGAVDQGYPRELEVWRLQGQRVTAAMQWTNARTYFFNPTGNYIRYDDMAFTLDTGYPRDVASAWLGCTRSIQAGSTPSTDDGDGDNGVVGLVPSLLGVACMVLAAINL